MAKLDQLLSQLRPGGQVVVTRLRHISGNHQHLLGVWPWFGRREVVVAGEGVPGAVPVVL